MRTSPSSIPLSLAIFWAWLLCAPLPGLGQDSAAPFADPSAPLVARAVASHPDVLARGHQVQALEAAVSGSRRWMDPMLSVELSNVPWRSPGLGQSPMSGVQLRLEQPLPVPGVQAGRASVATARVRAGEVALEEAQLRLAGAVRDAFWGLAHVRAQVALQEAQIAHVEALLSMTEARYSAGGGDRAALLRFTLLRDRLEDGLGDLARDAGVLQSALNAVLGDAPGTPIPTPPLDEARPAPGANLEALMSAAEAVAPALKAARAEGIVAREEASLARAQRFGGARVWAGYRIRAPGLADGGADFVSLGVGIPLPLDGGGYWQGEVAAAQARSAAAEERFEAARLTLRGSLEAALLRWTRAGERAQTYGDRLLPLGRQGVEASRSAFSLGQVSFEALYQSQIALLELERALLAARAETYLQGARVDTLMGEGL